MVKDHFRGCNKRPTSSRFSSPQEQSCKVRGLASTQRDMCLLLCGPCCGRRASTTCTRGSWRALLSLPCGITAHRPPDYTAAHGPGLQGRAGRACLWSLAWPIRARGLPVHAVGSNGWRELTERHTVMHTPSPALRPLGSPCFFTCSRRRSFMAGSSARSEGTSPSLLTMPTLAPWLMKYLCRQDQNQHRLQCEASSTPVPRLRADHGPIWSSAVVPGRALH